MPQSDGTFTFLRNRNYQILAGMLVLHAVLFYSFLSPEPPVAAKSLAEFPSQVDEWHLVEEHPVEPEVQEVLRADDTLNRTYGSHSQPVQANFFVAFFRSQQSGQAPHSPKNCLPGSGWEPRESAIVQMNVAGRPEPIEVNRYIVQRGEAKAMVLYWYQSHGRVVASEYWSKVYLVLDALRYHRSDTALVRVVIPVVGPEDQAEALAKEFVTASFEKLSKILPS